MRVTYGDPEGRNSIRCDVSTRRAALTPLYLYWSIKSNESGITFVKLELLLADKISTYGMRADRNNNNPREATDLVDIKFCMTENFLYERMMPEELKPFYTSANWNQVIGVLTADEAHERWDIMARALEVFH